MDGEPDKLAAEDKFSEPRPRKRRSSRSDFEHGHLTVKCFLVLEPDLDDLGRMNRDTAVLTAVATGFGGFALEVSKDLLLSSGSPANAVAFFSGMNAVSIVIACVSGVLAVLKWLERGAKLKEIKKKVKFYGDQGASAG